MQCYFRKDINVALIFESTLLVFNCFNTKAF
jgi:hypothetical protein